MYPKHRALLKSLRRSGFDIFVIPDARQAVSGVAFEAEWGRRSINIVGSPHSVHWAFVLLHEVAHHVSGDCMPWRGIVAHVMRCHVSMEYHADQWALRVLRRIMPSVRQVCLRNSDERTRDNCEWAERMGTGPSMIEYWPKRVREHLYVRTPGTPTRARLCPPPDDDDENPF